MSFPYDEVIWLVGMLGRMPYGRTERIAPQQWRAAIPRPSPLNFLYERPETEREPLDWVRFWMNGTEPDDFMIVLHAPYMVREDLRTGDLLVTLPVKYCPQCQGRGQVRSYELPENDGPDLEMDPMATTTITTRTCWHEKQPGDPLRTRWP